MEKRAPQSRLATPSAVRTTKLNKKIGIPLVTRGTTFVQTVLTVCTPRYSHRALLAPDKQLTSLFFTSITMANSPDSFEEIYQWLTPYFRYTKGQGSYLPSPTFVSKDKVITWRLIFYPTGVRENPATNYTSVYLKFESPVLSHIVEKWVKYKFSVYHGGILLIQSTPCCTRILNHYRQPDMTSSVLLDAGILWQFVNFLYKPFAYDAFAITCEWTIIEACPITYGTELSNHHRKFRDFLKSDKFSDVTLVTGKQEFKAHKLILAAHSPVFSAMFEHKMQEKQLNQVKITDIEGNVLEEFLRFIYTGETLNLHQNDRELLAAANKYDIEPLKNECEKSLQKSLCVENCIDILILADLHNAKLLKKAVMDLIVKHADKIVETRIYLPLQKVSYNHLLSEVFCAVALKK